MSAADLRAGLAKVKQEKADAAERTFTREQLSAFDGSDGGPIYMGMLGDVFDVTKGKGFYGKGRAYGIFAGQDASRGLGTMKKNPEHVLDPSIESLTPKQRKTAQEWHDRFVKKYPIVGTLVAQDAAAAESAGAALSWTDDTATVPVPGLREPLRVLHLGDSHINVDSSHHYQTDDEQLRNGELIGPAIAAAAADGAHLVVHTGDLVHGVSPETVEHLSNSLVGPEAVLPFLYISGNADWMHESTPAEIDFEEKDARRSRWREANTVLYDGAEPSVWVRDVVDGQLRFVGVDNSTGQVTQAQLESVMAADDGTPTVLMLHIPLCLPETLKLVPGAGSLCGNPDCEALPASSSTQAFLAFVRESTSIVAVLAGHIHQPQAQMLREGSGAGAQLVTAAAKDGGSRLIDFVPAQTPRL